MGWFDDNASKLAAANIPRSAAEDFIRRNPGDFSRIQSALGPDYARREERGGSSGGGDGRASESAQWREPTQSSSWLGRSEAVKIPYTPWTEEFRPSVAMPSDLMDPWTRTFAPSVSRPADLLEPWTRMFTAPSAADVAASPAVQLRLDRAREALERSAAAKGSYLTPNTMRAITEDSQRIASEEYDREYGRRRGDYEGDFDIFAADKGQRGGMYFNQVDRDRSNYEGDFDIFSADKGRRAGTYFNQLDRDQDLFRTRYDIHRNNQLDPFGMGMQVRGQDRADRTLDFDINQSMWGRGITERQEGRADRGQDFSMNDLTRRFDFERDTNAWNRSRTTYRDKMDDLYRFGELGTRRPPR